MQRNTQGRPLFHKSILPVNGDCADGDYTMVSALCRVWGMSADRMWETAILVAMVYAALC